MKYCTSCGGQIPENMNFCPNCGAPVAPAEPEPQVQPQPTEQPINNPQPEPQNFNTQGSAPMLEKRSKATCIILSIVTGGLYGIIWFVKLVNDVNAFCQDEKSNQSGGTVFLLTLITCGIYGWIWFYNAGKRMNAAGTKYNATVADNAVLYLILMIVGLGIIDYCMIQSELNKFAQ